MGVVTQFYFLFITLALDPFSFSKSSTKFSIVLLSVPPGGGVGVVETSKSAGVVTQFCFLFTTLALDPFFFSKSSTKFSIVLLSVPRWRRCRGWLKHR